MRWSLPSSFFIFAVLIAGEVAVSAPINVDSNILLEVRSPVTTRAMTRAQSHNTPQNPHHGGPHLPAGPLFQHPPPQNHATPLKPKDKAKRAKAANQVRLGISASPLRAGHFKKSSGTYRKSAQKGPTYHRTGRSGLVKTKTGSSLDPGTHADHMVEAQTVAHAVEKAGLKKSDIHADTMHKVKDVLNGPENMAVISGPLNIKKGQHTTSKLAGGAGSSDPHVHRLMGETRDKTTAVAKKLNKVFEDGGNDVNVLSAHMRTMKISDPKAAPK